MAKFVFGFFQNATYRECCMLRNPYELSVSSANQFLSRRAAPKRSLSQRVGPWREALSLNSNRTIYEGDRSRRGAVLSSLVVRSRSTGRGDQSRIRCLK